MKKKVPLLTIILYLLLFAIISAFIFIYYFEKKLGPELITCAENQVKYLENIVINNSIRKYNNLNNQKNYLEIQKNNKGEIIYIRYNTKTINDTTTKITEILEKDLHYMMKGNFKKINLQSNIIADEYYEKIKNGVVFVIPIGSVTGKSLLANIGPKIPLKLKLVGEVNTKIKTNVKEYGLNNAMIEIYAEIKSTTKIQMPFLSKDVTVKNQIPLTIEIIQNSIPQYYLNTPSKNY